MKDNLIKHGTIILSSSFSAFFLAYLYHFYMARTLGPEGYGTLGTLISIYYILVIPSSALTLAISHIVSEFSTESEDGKIKDVLVKSLRILFLFGLFVVIFLAIISPFIKQIFGLYSIRTVILLGASAAMFNLLPALRGVLQGIQNFWSLGLNIAFEKLFLLFFGIILVKLGFGIDGAVLAYGLSAMLAFVIAILPLRKLLNVRIKSSNISLMTGSWPIFLLYINIGVMSNADVLIVKHYFTSQTAGFYVAMSTLGRVIYFSAIALGGVILPKVVSLDAMSQNHEIILKKAIVYFSIGLSFILSLYYLFPEAILSFLFGENFSTAAPYLARYALAMGIFSLALIFIFYNMSLKKNAFVNVLPIFSFIEFTLLILFHNSIEQVISVLIITFSVLLALIVKLSYIMNYLGVNSEAST